MRFEDFFSGYAQQMKGVRTAQLSGDIEHASTLLPKLGPGHNAFDLSLLEGARLNYLKQDWQQSKMQFAHAYQNIERSKAKAKLQISRGLQNVGAVASNDSAIGYVVPAYEQSMLHSYQALNYLFLGSLESALVEVRRANLIQENALRENEEEIFDAQKKMEANGIDSNSLYDRYPSMAQQIGQVKNGFQNAFTFYLSGMLYEAAGELNDAYIDYKKAVEIFPDNTYLQKDVLRLAMVLAMENDIAIYSERFDLLEDNIKKNEKEGSVVVLYEQGAINTKQELRLNLPLFTRDDDMRFYSFSLPVYREASEASQPLYLHHEQQVIQADDIVVLQSLASKVLRDQLPSLVTRQALRLIAKEKLRKKMSKEGGDVGNILASLYSMASERADTRSWLTLPKKIQLLKVNLPAGTHTLNLEHSNGSSLVEVVVNPNRLSLINVTTVGNFTGIKATSL